MVRLTSGLRRVYESSQVMESRLRCIVETSRNVGVILRLRPKSYREEETMVGKELVKRRMRLSGEVPGDGMSKFGRVFSSCACRERVDGNKYSQFMISEDKMRRR